MISIGIPILGSVLILICGKYPNLRETVTLVTSVLMFISVCLLIEPVIGGQYPEIVLFEFLPGLEFGFKSSNWYEYLKLSDGYLFRKN